MSCIACVAVQRRDCRCVTAMPATSWSVVQALATKLEDAMAAYSRSAADAERLLASKDALLCKWKAEAQTAASKAATLQARDASDLSYCQAGEHICTKPAPVALSFA